MAVLISKKVIKYWLDNYTSIIANDRPVDAIPSNSGKKSYDGISWKQIDRIMLQDAIEKLPRLLKKCVYARWVDPQPLGETLRNLNLTKDVYYKRCSWAIDGIYYHVNGEFANIQDLYNKIRKIR